MLYLVLWLVAVSPFRGTATPKNVPHLLNYDGFLASAADTQPVTDTLPMTFSLWSAPTGGTQYWAETHNSVPITRGYFHVVLGSVNPLPANLFNGRALYLQIQVGAETLSPREHIVSVPHSVHTLRADTSLYAQSAETANTASFAQESNHASRADSSNYATVTAHTLYADSALYASSADTANYAHESGHAFQANVASYANAAQHASRADSADYAPVDTLRADQRYLLRNRADSTVITTPAGPGLFIHRLGNSTSGVVGLWVRATNPSGPAYAGSFEGTLRVQGNVEVDSASGNGIHLTHAGRYGIEVDRADSGGFHVGRVSNGAGLVIDSAKGGAWVGTGVRIRNAQDDAIDIYNAGYWGLYLAQSQGAGIYLREPGYNGLYIWKPAFGSGIVVDSVPSLYGNGVQISYAHGQGIEINKAGQNGVDIQSAAGHGLFVNNAGANGIYVNNAGNHGVFVNQAGDDGLQVWSSGKNGIQVYHAGRTGLEIHRADSEGIHIGTVNNGTGLRVDSAKGIFSDGVQVQYAQWNGLSAWKSGFAGLYVGSSSGYGAYMDSTALQGLYLRKSGRDGLYLQHAKRQGLVVNRADSGGLYIGKIPHGSGIVMDSVKHNGIFIRSAGWNGIIIDSASWDGIEIWQSLGEGIRIYSAGGMGILVDQAQDWGASFNSNRYGLSAWGHLLGAQVICDTSGADYPALLVDNEADTTDSAYIARFTAGPWYDPTTRFYFLGNGRAYANEGWSTFKRNSRGEYESFSAIEAERQEIVAHGKARLVNGEARVSFPESFKEFVSSREQITVTVTPTTWSGLYVPEVTPQGFVVKSGAGDPNAEFSWIAIGVEKGQEVRPRVDNIAHHDSVLARWHTMQQARREAQRKAYNERRKLQREAVKRMRQGILQNQVQVRKARARLQEHAREMNQKLTAEQRILLQERQKIETNLRKREEYRQREQAQDRAHRQAIRNRFQQQALKASPSGS